MGKYVSDKEGIQLCTTTNTIILLLFILFDSTFNSRNVIYSCHITNLIKTCFSYCLMFDVVDNTLFASALVAHTNLINNCVLLPYFCQTNLATTVTTPSSLS